MFYYKNKNDKKKRILAGAENELFRWLADISAG